jgi:hypothetical protein
MVLIYNKIYKFKVIVLYDIVMDTSFNWLLFLYIEIVNNEVLLINPRLEKKCTEYYCNSNIRKNDILVINGKNRLINTITTYVKNEELFDIIYSTHTIIGHRG